MIFVNQIRRFCKENREMKRKTGIISLLIALVILCATVFVACGGKEFTVTFNGNGGTLVSGEETQTVKEGQGVTAPVYERLGYTLSWGISFDSITENLAVDASWTPIAYTITYILDGGTNHPANPDIYTIESEAITLQAPSKAGYTFAGFAEGNTITPGSTGNKSFAATWTVSGNTAYKTEHKQEQLYGTYDLIDTDNLTGATAADTNAAAKSYEGFTPGTVTQTKIAADGSTVVTILYTRNS